MENDTLKLGKEVEGDQDIQKVFQDIMRLYFSEDPLSSIQVVEQLKTDHRIKGKE